LNKGLLHGKFEKSENLHAATLDKMIFRYNTVIDIQTKAELSHPY